MDGVPNLPEKFPKKVTEGKAMDYSGVAFPKPTPRKKVKK